MQSKTTKTPKRLFPSLLLLLATLFVCFLLFKMVLRLGIIGNPLYRLLTPVGETSNPRQKIIVLGDSFIYNGGDLHERIVEELTPLGIKILSLAEPGRSPIGYLDLLRRYGASFKPDLIILCYYAGNDLTGVKYHKTTVSGDWQSDIKNFLRPHLSRLYTYRFFGEIKATFTRFDYEQMEKEEIDKGLISLAKADLVNPWLLSMDKDRREKFIIDNLLIEGEANQEAFAKIEKLIEEAHEISETLDSKLLVVIFPASAQVDRSNFDFFQKAGIETDDRTLSTSIPQDLIISIGERHNFPVLDMLPAFRARSQEEFYLENDTHFNDKGNKLAAELMIAFITEYLGEH